MVIKKIISHNAFVAAALTLASAAVAAEADGTWQLHNRSISVGIIQKQQQYVELDSFGLTPDGILDQEHGRLHGQSLQARWQGTLATVPLWVQASLHSSKGQTIYQGYLQSKTSLTPFGALTGNRFNDVQIRMGMPWQAQGYALQLVPYVDLSRHTWQRNLLQYSENYQRRSHSLGLLAQWSFTPHVVLEVSHQLSRYVGTNVNVPSLAFAITLGQEQLNESNIALSYRISNAHSIGYQFTQVRHRGNQSSLIAGLQAPPSQSRQTRTGIALAWHF